MPELISENPATGTPVGTVETTAPASVPAVVSEVRSAARAWGARSVKERATVVRRFRHTLLRRADEVVDLLVREGGKTPAEAWAMDLAPLLELCAWAAGEAERILAPHPIALRLQKHRASYLHHVPRGVVAVVAPWNFPASIPHGCAASALVAGNGVVLKPSELTPLVADLLADFWREAGLPEGVLRVVHGHGDVGAALVEARPDFVLFTGSVATGRKVAARCGELLVPCAVELGGKAPALVLPDCDLERTAAALAWGGCANAGQVCASVERVLVHESVAEPLRAKLVEHLSALTQGDPALEGTQIGPQASARQRDRIARLVAEAVDAGATAVVGGSPGQTEGHFYPPTLLTDVDEDMAVWREEIFGPVLPLRVYDDVDEMVAAANDNELGLCAYVFSDDTRRARELAERLEAGTVQVNEVLSGYAMPETPWHGLKASGLGVTHGDEGLRALTQTRHVNYDVLPPTKRELWWYPYSAGKLKTVRRLMRLVYGKRPWERR